MWIIKVNLRGTKSFLLLGFVYSFKANRFSCNFDVIRSKLRFERVKIILLFLQNIFRQCKLKIRCIFGRKRDFHHLLLKSIQLWKWFHFSESSAALILCNTLKITKRTSFFSLKVLGLVYRHGHACLCYCYYCDAIFYCTIFIYKSSSPLCA